MLYYIFFFVRRDREEVPMRRALLAAIVAALLSLRVGAAAPMSPIAIVAAENFYADIARQIAGSDATGG